MVNSVGERRSLSAFTVRSGWGRCKSGTPVTILPRQTLSLGVAEIRIVMILQIASHLCLGIGTPCLTLFTNAIYSCPYYIIHWLFYNIQDFLVNCGRLFSRLVEVFFRQLSANFRGTLVDVVFR